MLLSLWANLLSIKFIPISEPNSAHSEFLLIRSQFEFELEFQ